jgi:hypothetical protein
MKPGIRYAGGALLTAVLAVSAGGQVAPAMMEQVPVATERRKAAAADEPLIPEPTNAVLLLRLDQTPKPALGVADAATVPAILPTNELANAISAERSGNVERLLAFSETEVKFDISQLMKILRDSRHEGWVLAAYPDPKTGHPLIGAGFTLDLPARDHLQPDAENPHPFMEPSSAELWQAAGLDSERLQTILNQFDTRLTAWSKRGFRNRMTVLTAQISDEDAARLMRMAIIQSAYNAKGYCRDFDRLSASQQMALTQLVYQMGYNLQEFTTFLALVNNPNSANLAARTEVAGAGAALMAPAAVRTGSAADKEYWRTVQQSLVASQWARLYRARAVAVIAMLDPQYGSAPDAAEVRVGAMLRPATVRGRRRGASSARRTAGKSSRSRSARQRKRGI